MKRERAVQCLTLVLFFSLTFGYSRAMDYPGPSRSIHEISSSSSRGSPVLQFNSGHSGSSGRKSDTLYEPSDRGTSSRSTPPGSSGATGGVSSQRSSQIPAFEDGTGIIWGPYNLHKDKFQLELYPLNLPAFAHFYNAEESSPTPYPRSLQGYPLSPRPISYRPEPELLQAIRKKIFDRLKERDISAQRVDSSNRLFYEGMYLLPPLENTPSGLRVPTNVLENRILRVPDNRIFSRPKAEVNLFLLNLVTSRGPRQILATSTLKTAIFTPLPETPQNSKLWLFYERRKSVGTSSAERLKGTSFLGAMFLPKHTETMLLEAGDIVRYDPR